MNLDQKGFSPLWPLILLLIVGGLSAVAALTIYNKPNVGPSPSPSSQLESPPPSGSESAQINLSNLDLLLPTNNRISSYQLTIVDKTTDEEVSKLAKLKSKRVLGDGSTEYLFKAYTDLRDNMVITKGGKVIFERSVTVPPNLIHPRISDYITKYGQPELRLVGSKYYGPFENIYVYASKGVALVGTSFTDEIDEIQVFLPMKASDYIDKWGQDYVPGGGFLKEVL